MQTGINDHTGTLVPPDDGSRYVRTPIVARQNAAFHHPRHVRRIIGGRPPADCPQCFGDPGRCGVAAHKSSLAAAGESDEQWNWRRCPHNVFAPDFFAFEDVPNDYQPRLFITDLVIDAEVRAAFDGDGDGRRARAVAARIEREHRAAGKTMLDDVLAGEDVLKRKAGGYAVVLEPDEGGFVASCPDLPGCCSQGADEAEAMANVSEAIAGWLESAAAEEEATS